MPGRYGAKYTWAVSSPFPSAHCGAEGMPSACMQTTDEAGAARPSQPDIVTVAVTMSVPETWTTCGGVSEKEQDGG